MNINAGEIIGKTDAIAKKNVEISAILMFALLLIWLIIVLVFTNSIFTQNEILRHLFRVAAVSLLAVFLVGVVVRMVLSIFVKNDEETDFEQKVDYILQKNTETHSRESSKYKGEVSSHLINLTEAEKALIIQMMRNVPPHASKSDYINLAQMSQLLTALHNLNYLDDNDTANLRQWVEQVTGKNVPSVSQFNEAYPSTTFTKVNKATLAIQEQLSKLR